MLAAQERATGLSPLARRNQGITPYAASAKGPISAGAEEPTRSRVGGSCIRAYLRWRGGTVGPLKLDDIRGGLSPLARRNRSINCTRCALAGPISAGAEEPK